MSELLDSASVIFWGIVTFSILVVLHEGGHFAVARFFGVRVHEFMIGLPGPAVRYHSKSGTIFGITAVPLGGYVRIAGMEPGQEDPFLAAALSSVIANPGITGGQLAVKLDIDETRALTLLETLEDWGAIAVKDSDAKPDLTYIAIIDSADETPEEILARARNQTYRGLTTFKRIALLSAGVLVNLAAAIAVFTFVLSIWGYYEHSLTLSEVIEDSAAHEAGLLAGDTITALQGVRVTDWIELSTTVATKAPGDVLVVDYARDGVDRQTEVTLGESPEGRGFLGVGPEVTPVNLTVPAAFIESIGWVGLVFVAIGNFFNPETFAASIEGARGIIGISVEVERAAEAGPLSYAWIVALLSLSLGAMNILPIPPLDGGKIVLEIIEKIAGRPLHRNFTMAVSIAGAILLFGLIGYLMYADIMRYFVNT